jgi:hypothetical protein
MHDYHGHFHLGHSPNHLQIPQSSDIIHHTRSSFHGLSGNFGLLGVDRDRDI